MENRPPQQDEAQRATAYSEPTTNTSAEPKVGVNVYDRPDNVKTGGMNMMMLVLIVVALVLVGAVLWTAFG